MSEKHKQIIKLLWDFQSLREEQIIKMCKCNENDINYLIAQNAITRDRDTKILKYKGKEINSRNIVAFDVVMNYLDRNAKVKKARHPINVSMTTDFFTYDIIAIKEAEVDTLFEKLDEISNSEKIIVIIETKQYINRVINTKRPVCICTYPPHDIALIVNNKEEI